MNEMMRISESKGVSVKYRDPVCGMWLSADEAVATADYSGATYYFCSQGCAQNFEKDPADYVKNVAHEHDPSKSMHEHKGHKHGCGC